MELWERYQGPVRGGVILLTPLKTEDISMFLGAMANTTARLTKCTSSTLVAFFFLLYFFFASPTFSPGKFSFTITHSTL